MPKQLLDWLIEYLDGSKHLKEEKWYADSTKFVILCRVDAWRTKIHFSCVVWRGSDDAGKREETKLWAQQACGLHDKKQKVIEMDWTDYKCWIYGVAFRLYVCLSLNFEFKCSLGPEKQN